MFMVLTREGAVDGWRSFIGDTNPEEAKAKNPDRYNSFNGLTSHILSSHRIGSFYFVLNISYLFKLITRL